MQEKTLWSLPAQPLPRPKSLVGPVFVTIWMCIIPFFLYRFLRLWMRRGQSLEAGRQPTPKPWPEFKIIVWSVTLLFLWYVLVCIDRWLHYDKTSVPFGYILFLPVGDGLYVSSAVLMLWGTYKVVWKEFDDRFSQRERAAWGFAANVVIFAVGVISLYYYSLYIALAIVWVQYTSLNSIDDIATKWRDFEVAMAASFVLFSFLTLIAAVFAIKISRKKAEGESANTRIPLFSTTVLLFVRSLSQLVIIIQATKPSITRQDTMTARDISHGIITVFFLGFMFAAANTVTTTLDHEGELAGFVKSDVRRFILEKLDRDTEGRQNPAPRFRDLIQGISQPEMVTRILEDGALSPGTGWDPNTQREVAQAYLRRLLTQADDWDVGEQTAEDPFPDGRSRFGVQSSDSPGIVSSIFCMGKNRNPSPRNPMDEI